MRTPNRLLLLSVPLVVALFCDTGCTQKARVARAVRKADAAFAAGQYESAAQSYEEVLHNGLDPHALTRLALCFSREGRVADTYAVLKAAQKLRPDDPQLETALAGVYVSSHDYRGGMEHAKLALTKQPTNAEAMLLLADSVASSKSIPEVTAFLRALPGLPPQFAPLHIALADLDLKARDFSGAEAEARQALAADGKSPEAHYFLSELYFDRADLVQATNELKAAVSLSPWDSNIRLRSAEFDFRAGRQDAAVAAVQEAVSHAPYYVPAWSALMRMQFSLKDYSACLQTLATIRQKDPDNEEAALQTGIVYLSQNNLPAAQTAFQNLEARRPNLPAAKYYLAVLALRQGEQAKARELLLRASSANTNYVQADLLLAEIDLRSDNSAGAVQRLERLVRRDPSLLEADLLLAQAYMVRQEPARAQSLYRQLIERHPKDPQLPYLLGVSQAQAGDPSGASKSFGKALELAPDYYPALASWVQLAVAEKQFDPADKFLRQRIDNSPKDAKLLLLLADVLQAENKNDQAEQTLNKAIAMDATLVPAYISLANLYLNEHKEDQAVDKLSDVVGRTNDISAFMTLGVLQIQLKRFPAARDTFKKALAFAPTFAPAMNDLAYIEAEDLNQLSDAVNYAEKAHELRPTDPTCADTLGWIFYKRGDYARALSLLQEGVDGQPSDPEVQCHLGMAHYMLGQEGLARQSLQFAVSSPVAFSSKDDARQRLAVLSVNPQTATDQDVASLQQTLQRDPDDPIAIARLGEIETRRAHFDKAADYYQQGLKSHPNSASMMARLAALEADHLNRLDDALVLARAAHKIDDANPLASECLGRLSYQRGDFAFAATLLQQAADADPTASVLSALARARYAVGKVAEAITALQQALAKEPGGAEHDADESFLALIQASGSPSTAKAALPQATAALQKDPHNLPALIVSAVAAQANQDTPSAKKYYDVAVNSFPQFGPALRQSALLYSADPSDDEKAYNLAQRAQPYFPFDAELAKILGRGSYRHGDYARSSQVLEEASLHLKDAEVFYYLGMDYFKLQRATDSKRALQKALALNLASPLASEAQQVLAQLK